MTLIKDAARDAAGSVLVSYWEPDLFPVDPSAIARSMSLKVSYAELRPDVSGFIMKDEGRDAEIFVDVGDSDVRQRFTVAHELGHYIERSSQRDPDNSFTFVEFRDGRQDDIHEFYANEFAGNLLMPQDAVRRLVDSVDGWEADEIRVARKFGVSVPAANVRLRRLGLAG